MRTGIKRLLRVHGFHSILFESANALLCHEDFGEALCFILDINLKGPFLLSLAVGKAMLARIAQWQPRLNAFARVESEAAWLRDVGARPGVNQLDGQVAQVFRS